MSYFKGERGQNGRVQLDEIGRYPITPMKIALNILPLKTTICILFWINFYLFILTFRPFSHDFLDDWKTTDMTCLGESGVTHNGKNYQGIKSLSCENLIIRGEQNIKFFRKHSSINFRFPPEKV